MNAKPIVLWLLSAAACSASTLSIAESTMREVQPGPMILDVTIASAAKTPPDVHKVRTLTRIFERGPRNTVALAKPDLSFRWLEGPVNWKNAAVEKLEVSYPGPKPGYTYVGYGIAIYYDGVLQETVFSSKSLKKKFPFPEALK
jgi:hypothetical protein